MEFNKVTPEIIEQLKVIAPGRAFSGEEINEDYAHDEMRFYGQQLPDAVVEVTSAEEVSAIVKLANEKNIPIIPRGAGTGLAGGAVAKMGGIVISTVRMNHIKSYDLGNLTVTVEPGVLLNDLAQDAEKQGLLYPPDPGEKFATLGGNVSTNAGGMRAVKYGCTRDYVRAMEVVLPTGEIVTFGLKVPKTSSGYSFVQLMCGSEGTLGIITELTLKLIPKPQETVSLIIPFEDLETAISCVPHFFLNKLQPQALEFMGRDIVEMSEKYLEKENFPKVVDGVEAGAYLLVTYDGSNRDQLDEICEQTGEVVFENGALDVFVADTPDKIRDAWAARSQFLEAIQAATDELDECDVVVPRDKIAEYFNWALTLQDKYHMAIRGFGHAGDGNLHIYACKEGDMSLEEFAGKTDQIMDEMYAKAIEMGGEISGEHGIGHSKVKFLEKAAGETKMNLMRGIKQVFDPNNILNPGKVCERCD
ncbi:MAG: FAD-binding oxidoreductase [Clostridiales bacterium]|nr:FAD-binding oxidoreductase [Clostridiales bacterium]